MLLSRTLLGAASCAALILAGAVSADSDSLTVFDWSGYENPNFFASYIAKHGEAPTFSYFGDEEEAFQKLRSGFQADLAHPCTYSVPKWVDAGLLAPIDISRIERWDDLDPAVRDMMISNPDGQPYLMPLEWGNLALLYNTELLDQEAVASLQAFADPEHMGRVSIQDSVYGAYTLAFIATGVTDWTSLTDEELRVASDFLRKVHPNIRDYWKSGADLAQLMQSGEVYLAWGWNETFTTLSQEGHPIKMNRDTEEGWASWVCGYAMLSNASGSQDKAYDFMNAWLMPESVEYMVEKWGYGLSNIKAMEDMDQSVVAQAGLDSNEELLKKRFIMSAPDPDVVERMIKEFEMIKAGF